MSNEPVVIAEKAASYTREELTELVARILYKAKFPLRKWGHVKTHAHRGFIERAERALVLIEREDARGNDPQAAIFSS